jgi:hypothetical protein
VANLLAGGRAAPETPQKPVALATTARLLVHARPGSAVQIDGKRTATVDAQGTGSVSLAIPAEYVIRVSGQGFSPVSRSIFLTADRELTITQVPAPRWAFEGGLADMSSPSVGVSWFPLPDFLSLGLGATTWALAFALNDKAVFASVPLTDPYVRLGIYLMPADWALRMYADVAAFVRVIHAPGVYFGLDPLAPVGLQAVVGAEIARTLRGGIFLEYAPTMYFTSLPNLFRASLGTGGISPGWIFNPTFVVNLLSFRMGYRWLL